MPQMLEDPNIEPKLVPRDDDLGDPLNSQYPSAGFIWHKSPF
jgi:hypothetical protein